MPDKIIFLHSAANKFPVIEGPCNIWNYSGDCLRYVTLTENLPSDWTQGEVSDLLNTAATQLKSKFINIDEEITTGRFYNSYLASSMGERNPYQNDFFLNLCRALILKEIAARDGHHIILVDDIKLGDAFLKTCKTAAISASWAASTPKSQNTYFLNRCRALGSGLRIALRHWRLGKKFKSSPDSERRPQTLWLMNWASDSTFSSTQSTKNDTFYGALAAQLEQSSQPITWLANPMSWIMPAEQIAESISKSKKNVVSTFEFITLKTIFNAVFGWLMFGFSIRRQLNIHDFNLAPIVIYTAQQEQSKPQIILALLYADIAALLAKKNLRPKAIIYPFENQPWEKVLLQGFRKYSSSTKLIGMQHAPFADNYVSSIPSSKQWQQNIAPDTLVAIGTEFYERLIQHSAPINKVKIGGYFRNPTLTKITGETPESSNNSTVILASCPMNERDSIELIQKTAVATLAMKNIQVVVNFHPMSGQQMIDGVLRRAHEITDCGHIKFVDGSARKWLEKSSLLIYNSSGTVFEAASLGIPSIYLGPDDRLDLDKMPGGSKLKCRTSGELKELIQELTTDVSLVDDIVHHARQSLKYTFSQPDLETWNKIISFS